MRPNLTIQELEQLASVTGRDPYPNNFPDDYDKSMVDPRVRIRTKAVSTKLFGLDTREAMEQGPEIVSVVANEAKDSAQLANDKSDATAEDQERLRDEVNIAIGGATVDSEVKQIRPAMDGKVFTTANERLMYDFAKRLDTTQLMDFLLGKDIEITVKSDFTGKIAGSILENGNIARRAVGASIPTSPSSTSEYATQAAYDAIKKLEGTLSTQSTYTGGNALIPWHVIQFNILSILEQNFPLIFKNATTTAEKVAIAKKVYVLNSCSLWVKGSGPSGNLATVRTLNANGVWVDLTNGTNTTNEVMRLTSSSNDSNRITADGYVINIVLFLSDYFYRFFDFKEEK